MKHVFLIKPAAGKKQGALQLIPRIKELFAGRKEAYEICVTDHRGHATELVAERCALGEPMRFYACGGDGTLSETLAGMENCPHAQITNIPCGSANDFLRMFPQAQAFADLEQVIDGQCVPMDGVLCNGKLALNICSMGMDADVASRMVKFKRLPLVSGPMAYRLGVAETFFHRFGRDLKVRMHTPQGVVEKQGRFLFALAANGQYYGGGYHGAPQASPCDGLLDFVLVDVISRFKILSFLSKYSAGKHIGTKGCHFFQGTKMEVEAAKPAAINNDGECRMSEKVVFEVLAKAVNFVLPKVCLPKEWQLQTVCAE